MMAPDARTEAAAAALLMYEGYRYTIVTVANGAVPKQAEAELWYYPPGVKTSADRWKFFGRRTAADAATAQESVVGAFKAWVEGRQEAEGGGDAREEHR